MRRFILILGALIILSTSNIFCFDFYNEQLTYQISTNSYDRNLFLYNMNKKDTEDYVLGVLGNLLFAGLGSLYIGDYPAIALTYGCFILGVLSAGVSYSGSPGAFLGIGLIATGEIINLVTPITYCNSYNYEMKKYFNLPVFNMSF